MTVSWECDQRYGSLPRGSGCFQLGKPAVPSPGLEARRPKEGVEGESPCLLHSREDPWQEHSMTALALLPPTLRTNPLAPLSSPQGLTPVNTPKAVFPHP